MEKQISHHEVKIVKAVSEHGSWIDAESVAKKAGVAPRTARAHLKRLADIGIIEQAEVFPAHRYRWSEKTGNKSYLLRLKAAGEVFGVVL